MTDKRVVISISEEELIKIKEIVMDDEKEEALKMLKTILRNIEINKNKGLKSEI